MGYGKVTGEDVARLQEILGDRYVLSDPEALDRYARDENAAHFSAAPDVVVKPHSTEQVAQILGYADQRKIPVTFRGQGTGLSCGAVPVLGGIVMSFEAMNRILEIDEGNLVAVVEAGVVLLELRQELEKHGLFYPADPGEKSSAIGGNVATNAGGMNGVKYGNTRGYILGLEAVLPSGQILHLGGKTIKRSSGYELLHLIVGSEGTLAAVTKVILRLIKRPKHTITLYVPFPSLNDAIKTVPEIIRRKITPTALEFLERESILLAEAHLGQRLPHHDADAYLLLRIDGDKEEELFFNDTATTEIYTAHNAVDVLVADTREAQARIWDLRGRFYEALVENRVVELVDTVVPPSRVADFMEEVKQLAAACGVEIMGFGHAGDGNVHLHLMKGSLSEEEWTARWPATMKQVYEIAVACGGTVSGEHGIGLAKKDYFLLSVGAEELRLMRGIKRLFDPHNILNPGKIFDLE
jgi:glycolate oxidase